MAKTQLTKNTTTGNWELTETDQGQTYTNTLQTDGLAVEGDIKLSITAKSGNAPVATSLSGTGASASLSGTTITLSKVVTNAGSTFTAGWINSKPTGNATLTLSGTVPTETKTCTPSSSTQTITPSSGKLLSSVVIEAVPEVETETKTVKSTLATATITPTAGKYINKVVVSPVVVEEQTVSPSTSTQTITPTSGKDYLSKVVVNAIQVETKSVKSTVATQTITPTSGKYISKVTVNPVVVQSKTATPSIVTQTISPSSGYDYLTSVKVNPIPSEYIIPTGTITITQQTGTDVTSYKYANVQDGSAVASATKGTVSGNKVTVTPKVTKTAGWISTETVSGTGVEVTASELVSGTKGITENGTSINITNYKYVDVNVPQGITPSGTITITKQTGTDVTNYASANVIGATYGATLVQGTVSNHQVVITPSVNVSQTGWVGSGKTGTSITVKASDLVSGSKSISGSGSTDVTNYESVDVPAGSPGTPVANASAVNNHKITITPKVTNTTGWISGGTISGTAITISASDLVSGTAIISGSGTTDVTDCESVDVPAASNFTLEAIDNTGVVTVGTKSSGYYPLTNNVQARLTAGNEGWFHSERATDDSVQVGKIQAAALSITGTISGDAITTYPGTLSVKDTYASISGKTRIPVTPTTLTDTIDTFYVSIYPKAEGTTIGYTTSISASVNVSASSEGYVRNETASATISGTVTATTSATNGSIYYLPITKGNVGQSSSVIVASSVSLAGDVVRLQANVAPVVHTPGWVTIGTAEPVILQATITLPTFKKVEVTASSTQIYKVIGTVTIKAVNSEEGTGVTLTDTYFKITSITTGDYQSGTYVTTVTYQTMATNTDTSGETGDLVPGWNTAATVVAYGSKSSGGKCILQFECGQATVAKCSSNSTKRLLTTGTSISSGTIYCKPIYSGQMQNELCWFYFDTHFLASSTYRKKCVFAKYVEISHDQNSQPSGTYSRSSRTIYYRYSSDGSSWTADSCGSTNSSSGQSSGNAYYYCCYYATTEYL